MQSGFWNTMAGKYERNQDTRRQEERISRILHMIQHTGLTLDGAKVLDIGAGTGAIAIPLAKMGAEVTAVDFSDGMLQKLNARAEKEQVSLTRTLHLDWDTVDLDAEGFRGAFDLVIASMTPAVRCPETFNLMLESSRGICYYSGWVHRRWDASYYDLYRTLFGDEFREGMHGFHLPFMYLYLRGFRPEVQVIQDVWNNDETVDEMVDSVCGFFHTTREIDDQMKDQIRAYYQSRAVDGRCHSETVATTGMMVWDMRKRVPDL